jgi:hypothetical protein
MVREQAVSYTELGLYSDSITLDKVLVLSEPDFLCGMEVTVYS